MQMAANAHPAVVNSMWLLENIRLSVLVTNSLFFSLVVSFRLKDSCILRLGVFTDLLLEIKKKINVALPMGSVALKDCLDPQQLSHTQTHTHTWETSRSPSMHVVNLPKAGQVCLCMCVCGWMCVLCIGASHVSCAFRGHFSSDPNWRKHRSKDSQTITKL